MKVLVVGDGWTGRKVFQEFAKHKLDNLQVTSHCDVFDALEVCDYDWVVNCAGVTGMPNVEQCEDYPFETFYGNITFPVKLRETISSKTRFAHFSSGCIYEGKIDSVDAKPNFFGSTYSTSKSISDTLLKDNSVVFRIRMPFTNKNEPKNYLTKVKHYAENGFLFNAGQNSLTDHDESIRVSVDLILNNADDGPYNLVNSGSVDLPWIVSKMKLNKEPDWITADDFNKMSKCKRSTCVIPAHESMSNINEALERAIYEGGF